MTKFPLVLAAAGMIGLVSTQAMADLSAADKTFVNKAAEGGLTEVQLGQMAQQKASSPKVKQFGERMVTDHTKANQDLQQIAAQANMTLPKEPSASQKSIEQKLRSTSGSAFDTAYMRDMVSDHREDVADFRKEAQSGQDPAVKAFAQKYLPTLEQHLSMAESAATTK